MERNYPQKYPTTVKDIGIVKRDEHLLSCSILKVQAVKLQTSNWLFQLGGEIATAIGLVISQFKMLTMFYSQSIL